MDVVVTEVDEDGRVRFQDGEWSTPSLQERRAIIYAANNAIEELQEAIDRLQDGA
ncbi:MAG TPA: hypothetical protein VNZ26_24720 [Vicinamibacterales bacterium]|jgi:hypothetical protein|nr:hypothetical protein [Vicinamibacterales bacterium]